MFPFPGAYPTILQPDDKVNAAFEQAMNGLTGAEQDHVRLMPITIARVQPGTGSYPSAGQFQQEVDYSASLLKVAVMYAAFELHRFVTAVSLLPGGPSFAPVDQFLDAVAADFDGHILDAVPRIRDFPGMPRQHVVPDYKNIFRVHEDPLIPVKIVEFHPTFEQHLHRMIRDSEATPSATHCIQALGYGYINGALLHGGFFREPDLSGIWIAGDFKPSGRKDVRIPSVNDGDVAQATTTFDMANLYALINEEILTGVGGFSPRMRDLLANPRNAWFVTPPPNWDDTFNVVVTHTKVGLGPLKAGGDVFSEGIIVHEKRHEADFVVVYQDLRLGTQEAFGAVAKLIEATIDAVLA
ncbi:hypothetical protein [Streptomyces bambusae]|uniref:Uncharacterized protein n=1 Tax=Streptomyces bambusae TaxID=1550616 RepID=A0ABS6ZB84_9ACTN|nr:hypothetical protein [Streptomyces bambusae]MBW5485032.1 hypothetical protein [Streptomyces bambusae]